MSAEYTRQFPFLSALILVPLFTMFLAWTVKSNRQAVLLGLIAACLELGLSAYLLGSFDATSAELQFVEHIPFTPFLAYHLGVDGISLLFVNLTALLALMVILYGEIVHENPAGIYVASVFALQAVLMALFLSVDLLEFWVVCLLELIPSSFILSRWGSGLNKRRALLRYLQNMAGGLGLMLAALLVIGWNHAESSGDWSFALTDLLQTPLSKTRQSAAFVLLFYALATRMALFPFHGWLPLLVQHGPMASLCVFLVGLKVGIYALLRFLLPLLPEAAQQWKSFVVGLSIVGIYYGALLALMQINLRRLLAFSAVSQSGMLMIGLFCLNREGLQGSLILSVNFGVAGSALLFVAGVLHRSTHTALMPRLGGMFEMLPLLGLTFLLASLSTMTMPGTPGFDAAHLMLEAAIESHHWGIAIAMALGSVATAAFLLRAFQRVFLARQRDTALHPEIIHLNLPEVVLVSALCAVQLGIGFYSEPWLELVDAPLVKLSHQLESHQKPHP